MPIIGACFPEAERGRVIGTWAGFSAIATGVGPLLGGWIVDYLTWRAIFLITPFLALFAIWLAWRHLPESYDPEAPAGIDWSGSLLAFAGLGGLAFGLIALPDAGLRDMSTVACLSAGVLLLIAFVWREGRSRSPMMPLGLFRSRTFSGINVLTLLLYGALGGAFFLLPFQLIQVHGYSASVAGAAFLPFTIIMGVLSRWFGGLFDRVGVRLPLIIGPMVAAIGFTFFALSGPAVPYWMGFLLPISVVGLGMAVHVVPLTTAVIKSVPEHHTGVASGVNNAVASLANLLAIAIFGAVALSSFNRALDHHLQVPTLSSGVRHAIDQSHGNFVVRIVLDERSGRRSSDRRSGRQRVSRPRHSPRDAACSGSRRGGSDLRTVDNPTEQKPLDCRARLCLGRSTNHRNPETGDHEIGIERPPPLTCLPLLTLAVSSSWNTTPRSPCRRALGRGIPSSRD